MNLPQPRDASDKNAGDAIRSELIEQLSLQLAELQYLLACSPTHEIRHELSNVALLLRDAYGLLQAEVNTDDATGFGMGIELDNRRFDLAKAVLSNSAYRLVQLNPQAPAGPELRAGHA